MLHMLLLPSIISLLYQCQQDAGVSSDSWIMNLSHVIVYINQSPWFVTTYHLNNIIHDILIIFLV